MAHSSELWQEAQTIIPGGVNSPVRAFRSVGGDPIFFKQGTGPYLIDVDDKKYVDYVGSWGPLILGHSHPNVIAAVQQAAALGLGFGAPTPIEVEMARTLTRLIPSMEKVRMVSSGTESTQTALRLARGFTGRKKILKFEGGYHGHADCLLVKAGSGCATFGHPNSAGVPEEFAMYTLTLPFNDLPAVEKLFSDVGHEIAAIIVEPICGNMNCIPPLPEFLPGLRHICNQYQTVLIFDEVITGFRVALQGAQSLYHVTPDLTCLGKIIGGGLPVAAFGGKQEIMNCLSPEGPVYQAGTLSGNPVALAAGLATLRELQKPGIYQELNQKTEWLTQGLMTLATDYDIPFTIQRVGSMFGFFFGQVPKVDRFINYQQVVQHSNQEYFKKFFHGMLKEGVYFAPSAFESGFISLAHTEETIDYTLNAAKKVFQDMQSTLSWKNKTESFKTDPLLMP